MSTTKTAEIGNVKTIAEGGFTAPAYRPARYERGEVWGDDWTGDNRAAHGSMSYTEEEDLGGRQRHVVRNGRHVEVGPWGPTRLQREREALLEQRKKVDAEKEAIRKQIQVFPICASAEKWRVVINGDAREYALADLRRWRDDDPTVLRQVIVEMIESTEYYRKYATR